MDVNPLLAWDTTFARFLILNIEHTYRGPLCNLKQLLHTQTKLMYHEWPRAPLTPLESAGVRANAMSPVLGVELYTLADRPLHFKLNE